jgi:hypothetical protein
MWRCSLGFKAINHTAAKLATLRGRPVEVSFGIKCETSIRDFPMRTIKVVNYRFLAGAVDFVDRAQSGSAAAVTYSVDISGRIKNYATRF